MSDMLVKIQTYPYASQSGRIWVPEEIANTNNIIEIREWIDNHWDRVDFDVPDLDYCDTDVELYDEHWNVLDRILDERDNAGYQDCYVHYSATQESDDEEELDPMELDLLFS